MSKQHSRLPASVGHPSKAGQQRPVARDAFQINHKAAHIDSRRLFNLNVFGGKVLLHASCFVMSFGACNTGKSCFVFGL